MSTMNVLICQQPKELVWKQREIPIPGDNEALIKIKSVGICGTDIHAWGGNQPFFSYPRVLGHEICGEIVGLGKNIADLKNGQQVAVIPYVACQQCPACKSGRTNCCEKISVIGVHQDGGFSEYLSVPVANILPADGIDPQAAALIEPFAISAHAVRRAAIAPGEQVLVVGAGPIGLGAAAIAKADKIKIACKALFFQNGRDDLRGLGGSGAQHKARVLQALQHLCCTGVGGALVAALDGVAVAVQVGGLFNEGRVGKVLTKALAQRRAKVAAQVHICGVHAHLGKDFF